MKMVSSTLTLTLSLIILTAVVVIEAPLLYMSARDVLEQPLTEEEIKTVICLFRLNRMIKKTLDQNVL